MIRNFIHVTMTLKVKLMERYIRREVFSTQNQHNYVLCMFQSFDKIKQKLDVHLKSTHINPPYER